MPDSSPQIKTIILYDTHSAGGSTSKFVDTLGTRLAEHGAYVEKAKCKANANYSFIREFDLAILGSPVYYMVVSSDLLGALIQSNLKKALVQKPVALFLACGSPEPMANLLYMPQLKMHLMRSRIIAEKIFSPHELTDNAIVESYADKIFNAFDISSLSAGSKVAWASDAIETLDNIPSFLREELRQKAIDYAEEHGMPTITAEMLFEARDELYQQNKNV